jgi:hypothetical protein
MYVCIYIYTYTRGNQKVLGIRLHRRFVASRFRTVSTELLVISTWKKRLDRWQAQWFLRHDNAPSKHRLLGSSSSPRKTFLSSPNHRTLRILLRVTTGCSLLLKCVLNGHDSQPWRTPNPMRRPNSGRFQKKPSAGTPNNGKIDRVSVCLCVCVCVRARAWVSVAVHYNTTIQGTFWLRVRARARVYACIYIYIVKCPLMWFTTWRRSCTTESRLGFNNIWSI